MKNRVLAMALVISISAGLVPSVALAGENEAKNAAIGATAVSAYLLSHRGSRNAGLVGAAGSVYLWKKYGDSRSARRHKDLARENRARSQAAYWRSRYRAERRYAMRTTHNRRSTRIVRAR